MIPSILFQGMGTQSLTSGGSSGKGDGGFADILGRITERGSGGSRDGGAGSGSLTGHSGLTGLKTALMASGRSLESYTANGEAVSEFGSMLVKMGFDSAEVDEMVSTLKSRAATGTVTLADLFKGASQLTEPDTARTALLDISAMSDLEAVLGELGLDAGTARSLLTGALVDDGQAIDLETLAAGLRRELAVMADTSGTVSDNAGEILARLEGLGLGTESDGSVQAALDELISEVSRINDLQEVLEDAGEADGLPGSLLISYLQQLTAPLGAEGRELRQLIASAGTEDGGFDSAALLSKLVQMKQEGADASQIQLSDGQSGRMSLERFATMLESRVAEGSVQSRGGAGTMADAVGGFIDNVTPAAEASSREIVFPVDPESDATLKAEWQPDSKRYAKENRFSRAAGSASDTVGKQEGAPSSTDAFRQTVSAGEAERQLADGGTGKQTGDRLNDLLGSAGKEKGHAVSNDSAVNADGLVRDLKAGGDAAAMARGESGRNLPSYLLNQVSRQIVRLRNAGESDITLQLKPPHLGRMKLNIEHVTGGGLRVGIVVESAAAKDMLLAHSHDLKTALADQGLRLDRIDVEAQADFGQSMAQADQGFERFGGGKGRWTGTSGGQGRDTSAGAGADSGAGLSTGESGRLDLVA